MTNNNVANISQFENLQNTAHTAMGMPQSQMAVFNEVDADIATDLKAFSELKKRLDEAQNKYAVCKTGIVKKLNKMSQEVNKNNSKANIYLYQDTRQAVKSAGIDVY